MVSNQTVRNMFHQGLLVAAIGLCQLGCADDMNPMDERTDTPLVFEVNPFIGTDLEGQTFPGALVPWGMVSASPHTSLMTIEDVLEGVDFIEGGFAFSGYKWGHPTIHGFGTAHLRVVGPGDKGQAAAPHFARPVSQDHPCAHGSPEYREEFSPFAYRRTPFPGFVRSAMTGRPEAAGLRPQRHRRDPE